MTCAVPDCTGAVRSRGWCNAHYLRWRKTGDPTGTTRKTVLLNCWGCGQSTRPFGAKLADHPNTVARGRRKPTLLCISCHQRVQVQGTYTSGRRSDPRPLPEATADEKSATLRLLEKNNVLDLAPMLGL